MNLLFYARYRPNPTRNPSQHRTLPQKTLDYLAHGASKGNRNPELFAAAQQFRDAGYSQAEAEPRLLQRGMADGLSEAECLKTIASGYSQPARAPAGNPGGNGAHVGPSPAKSVWQRIGGLNPHPLLNRTHKKELYLIRFPGALRLYWMPVFCPGSLSASRESFWMPMG